MPPRTRKGWRKNYQLMKDKHNTENLAGSTHHHISSQPMNGASEYNNGRGSTSNPDDARLSQEASRHEEGSSSQHIKKKTRGPTYMKHLWATQHGFKPPKVYINKRGQPIGENKSQFVEFMGTIAKMGGYAPIDVTDWRDMPWDKKKEMLNVVQKTFTLPPGMDNYILQSLNKRWKNWKAELKAKYFDQNEPIEVQTEVGDERVMKDQWINLMTHWKSEEAQVLSQKNKEARGKKVLNHTTGKKSFAQREEEMKCTQGDSPSRVQMFKKCYTDKQGQPKSDAVAATMAEMDKRISELSPNSCDEISPDDIFAQVVGEERNGRVRMLGGGVAPSDLWDFMPSRKTSYRLSMERKSELDDLKIKYQEQAERIAHLEAMVNQQTANGLHHNSGVGPHSNARMTAPTTARTTALTAARTTALTAAPTTRSLVVGGKVSLKSMRDASKTVAKGYLHSLNSDDILHGHILGEGWCEVHVEAAMDSSEVLIRPFDMFDKLEDVLGCSIAWPTHLVVYEEFDMQ